MKKLLLVLLLAGCTHGGVTWENDIYSKFDKNRDRAYTNGFAFSYFDETDKEKETYTVGQNIYTPDTKKSNPDLEIIKQSRPYSGWLYGEYRDAWFPEESVKNIFGIQVGCTGKCSLARPTQQGFHKLIGQDIPTWEEKFALGTEPGVILEAERYYKLYENNFSDLVGYGTAKAGNIIDNAALGAEYRIGYNLDKFSKEPIIFKTPRIPLPQFKGYFFIRGEERLVAYNYFLEGSMFHEENFTVTPKVSVQELDAGIILGYDNFSFTYRYTTFSDEWTSQKGSSAFGGLNFNW